MGSQELQKLKAEHEKTLKMFIDRDIDLRQTNKKLEQEQKENKKTIKMLIQRDIQFRQINERLEAMDREKSQFISIAAHQLRTPLTAIKWLTQILQKDTQKNPHNPQKEQINKLNEIVQKVVNLVGDILNVSRIEEGRFGLKYSKASLGSLLKDILKTVEVSARSRKITIKKNIGPKLPESEFDPEKMHLALANIIDNAIKYTPTKGTVNIKATKKDSQITITMSDTGIGIPKEDHGRLFDKFYRGNNALKQETEGTGLGLFITHNIIKAHSGTINFDSRKGVGTTFTITLPITQSSWPPRKKFYS